uniref:Uncharacterized protein n=1 Tax=Musa acuminata subsp. malaccensis TaxID=214687 RepID=A0A804HXS2_MUSAM
MEPSHCKQRSLTFVKLLLVLLEGDVF